MTRKSARICRVIAVLVLSAPVIGPAGLFALEPAERPLPRYSCPLAKAAPEVDGDLTDQAWKTAPAVVLRRVSDGALPERLTVAMMCRDEKNLYIAFRCEDPDIWSDFRRRDEHLWNGEVVEAFIRAGGASASGGDTDADATTYFEFEVSPRNVVWDGLITNVSGGRSGMKIDQEWNCAGLRTAVSVIGTLDDRTDRDERWSVEIAIPLRSISASTGGPKAGESRRISPPAVWRINLFRIERGAEMEQSAWSPTFLSPPEFHVPSMFGFLLFSR
jgi:hypothetical protein